MFRGVGDMWLIASAKAWKGSSDLFFRSHGMTGYLANGDRWEIVKSGFIRSDNGRGIEKLRPNQELLLDRYVLNAARSLIDVSSTQLLSNWKGTAFFPNRG